MTEAETGEEMRLQAQECCKPPEAGGRRQDPPLEPPGGASRGTWPCDTLISDFWVPELGGPRLLLLKPPSLWCFVTGTPESHSGTEKAGGIGLLH